MAQAKTTNSEKATGAATYKKEQLVASKRYANRRDLIRAGKPTGCIVRDADVYLRYYREYQQEKTAETGK